MIRTDVVQPLGELLGRQAVAYGNRAALSDPGRSVTYAQLDARTASLAAGLASLGVRHGERVLLFMRNSVSLVEAHLATVRAEATAVCISAASTPDELQFFLQDSDPRVVVTDATRMPLVTQCLRDVAGGARVPVVVADGDVAQPGRHAAFEGLISAHSDTSAPDGLPLDAPAWMLYTSGTTGRPKGVLLSQRSMLWVVAAAWLPFLELSSDDVALSPLPLSHSYPLDVTLALLAAGGRTHLLERFTTPEVMAALGREQATLLLCVPTTITFLLNAVEDAGFQPDAFPALRFLLTAGAVVPAAVVQRAERRLGVPVLDAYGSTEASTAIALNGVRGGRIPGSCGVAAPGWAVRIVGPTTGRDVPVGEEGELIARGPGVMLGYHNRPTETAQTLRDGWYRTGDLARQDRNSYITISGRVKDIIIRGGENIAPAEIENVLMHHSAVVDCAVVGRPDDVYGEVPAAYVVRAPEATVTADELMSWCAGRLARFKVPASVHFIEEIQKTASGKVKRHLL
ncbi:MAG TPA: long-chain fatty acid--CoA ligase [Actinobacteria bacterium]|nr:long-chain fatty acid--CoA ligase [Actinomycetota bacterium]